MFRSVTIAVVGLAAASLALGATKNDITSASTKLKAAATAITQDKLPVALSNVTAAQALLVPAADFPKTRAELTAAQAALGQGNKTVAATRVKNATTILAGITGTKEPTTQPSSVSFKTNVQPILNARCITCHAEFKASTAFASIVNKKSGQVPTLTLVKPSKSAQSYLFLKVTGKQSTVGGAGATMPKGGPALTAAQISTIQKWIDGGALNN